MNRTIENRKCGISFADKSFTLNVENLYSHTVIDFLLELVIENWYSHFKAKILNVVRQFLARVFLKLSLKNTKFYSDI